MKKRKKNRSRLARLADMGCIVCLVHLGVRSPAEIHHPRDGMGMSQRASDSEAIPLCPIHHRTGDGTASSGGHWGYHKSPERFEDRYGTEAELLNVTNHFLKNGVPYENSL